VTYLRAFTLISFLHRIPGSDELAQTSLHITAPTTDPYPASTLQDNWLLAGASVAAGYVELWGASDIINASYSQFFAIKFAAVGTDGHYETDAEIYTLPTAVSGTGSDVLPQSTVVISLRSGSSFGDANFGRMYLPYTRGDNASTWQMSVARAAGIAGVGANFVAEINATAQGIFAGSRVCTLSRKGLGTIKLVEVVGCGRITDTQRRRREQLDENTQFVDVVP